MAINPKLLIAAPILQDYFVDNANAAAMSNGVITCYQDNSRTTLKNWYYQSGVPGAYTYITLSNPLTLSGVGTIEDPYGNDTIPFFYPYDESSNPNNPTPQPYYITVVNSNGQQQFVRQNFPFNPSGGSSGTSVANLKNLITNNVFWRNVETLDASTLTQSTLINGNTFYFSTISPSKHDGMTFQMSDMQYFKNTSTGDADIITFKKFVANFPDQILGANDITPEYYLNFNCSSSTGTATSKYFQIPIQLHVDSLSGYGQGASPAKVSIVIEAMAVTGSPNITVSLFQFLGTGVTSVIPVPLQTISLSSNWTRTIITTSFPSAQGLTLGQGSDDAFYLLINMPVTNNAACNINIAKPSLYLSNTVPTNDFQTYDDVNAVINSPRTGDVKKTFYFYYGNGLSFAGWVLMNDGVLSNVTNSVHPITLPTNVPSARSNQDTFPLFNYLWHLFNENGWFVFVPIYDNTGMVSTYGTSAILDFTANKQLSLPYMIGKVLAGADILGVYQQTFTTNFGAGSVFIVSSTKGFYTGAAIYFTGVSLPPSVMPFKIYYAIYLNGVNFQIATTYANALAGVVFNIGGNGTGTAHQFNVGGYTQQEESTALITHSHTLAGTGVANPTLGSGPGAIPSFNFGNFGNPVVGTVPLSGTTGQTGNANSFSLYQPTTYAFIYIKL